MCNLKMSLYEATSDYLLYEVFGDIVGLIEVQFDDGKFNGVICFCEQGTEDFVTIYQSNIGSDKYDYIVNIAIKDYRGDNFGK